MSSARRDFGYFASSFLGDYLTAKKGCSARTVASYRDAMVLLIEFIAADGAGRVTFADLTRERFE